VRALVVVLFLASTMALAAPACGGDRKAATVPEPVASTPAAPVYTCENVADNVAGILGLDRAEVLEECEEEELTAEDLRCFTEAATEELIEACATAREERMDAAVGGRDVEARASVQKLYDGARAYYLEEVADRSGRNLVPKQFPVTPSPDTAPPVGSCCDQPDRKCRPDPSLWNAPTWIELKFSMDDPHYYSYRYVSDGKSFTAQAIGDLDCDGVYATYELSGAATPDGNVAGRGDLKVTNGDE
jgi:hypothetical protein